MKLVQIVSLHHVAAGDFFPHTAVGIFIIIIIFIGLKNNNNFKHAPLSHETCKRGRIGEAGKMQNLRGRQGDEIIAGWKVQQQPFLVISFCRTVVYGLSNAA